MIIEKNFDNNFDNYTNIKLFPENKSERKKNEIYKYDKYGKHLVIWNGQMMLFIPSSDDYNFVLKIHNLKKEKYIDNNHKLPTKKEDRIINKKYIDKYNDIVIWNGKELQCIHHKRKEDCIQCGYSFCIHEKRKDRCNICSSLCIHNKKKYNCDNCNKNIFLLRKRKRKDENELDKLPFLIRDRIENKMYIDRNNEKVIWDGNELKCKHNNNKKKCIFCIIPILPNKGSGERIKGKRYFNKCGNIVIWDGKKLICALSNRNIYKCTRCIHGKDLYTCKECIGSSICEHRKIKYRCKICTLNGYLSSLMRVRLYGALKTYCNKKEEKTIEYLGCDIKTFREYFENLFTEGMCWEKMGEIHIDHRKPCSSFDLSKEEEIKKCFHYTNLQPLWANDNLSKSAKFDENTFLYKWCDIKNKWFKKICEEIC